ncbi:LacI family DNA-binding transcriptional regulator [Undibacterium jejuense]|uniref:LacI family DNA-binding transcriptional regulator n=1 Tax=Undibacterium jejuense TaxID=1344949 RepID=A0A923HHS9_9BURK|nr:LacI family DNA-binding transcriptional regulator [Undibacterium jejuense]MBC3864301.1 LacI family DNA-binding transcriptional regulator [Undibacterium jejuense]
MLKKQKITLKYVAETAGVSLASASYALNGGGSLGRETRERVIAVAQQLGYSPNQAAKTMRTGRTSTIGLVVPDLTNPFFPQLVQTVICALGEAGYETFVTNTLGVKEVENRSIQTLIQLGVDGLIWFPISEASATEIELHGKPTVAIDRFVPGLDGVVADCYMGGRLAAAMLIEKGHQRIGMINAPSEVLSVRQRTMGAREYVEEHGQLVWEVEASFNPDLDSDVIKVLAEKRVTGIIAGADVIAIGAIRVLRSLSMSVPEDVSVVGFDNIPWCELSSPPLSTISFPIHEIGLEAVKILLNRIDNAAEPHKRVVFDVEPIHRDSIVPPKNMCHD